MFKLLKAFWNRFLITFTISKVRVGGEVIPIDIKEEKLVVNNPVVKDTSWFAIANNLMDGDWTNCVPKVSSSNFDNPDTIIIREKEELLMDDIEFIKNHEKYARVIYPDKTVEL